MYSADAGVIVDIIESYGLGSEKITDIHCIAIHFSVTITHGIRYINVGG